MTIEDRICFKRGLLERIETYREQNGASTREALAWAASRMAAHGHDMSDWFPTLKSYRRFRERDRKRRRRQSLQPRNNVRKPPETGQAVGHPKIDYNAQSGIMPDMPEFDPPYSKRVARNYEAGTSPVDVTDAMRERIEAVLTEYAREVTNYTPHTPEHDALITHYATRLAHIKADPAAWNL